MSKVHRVRPRYEDPEFPKWSAPQTAAGFIIGLLLWVIMLIGFLFLFYVQLFRYNTHYLLSFIQPKIGAVPFWFAILMVVFFFPATLVLVLIGALVKILRD